VSSPKVQIFEQFAEVARTLGHAVRLELLEYVSQGERSVERLAQLTGQSLANTSQHLQQLRRNGLVQSRRDGKHVLYRVGSGPVQALLSALAAFAEQNRAEVRAITSACFTSLDALEPVSREEIMHRLRDGSVTLLDVRPEDEFVQGHLPGALNVSLSDLEHQLAGLPQDREIVAYCRGPYCVLSFEVVAALRSRGYNVRRLEDGFPEWKAAGLPTEAANAI
jgi:ArsR family transcriptional regulator